MIFLTVMLSGIALLFCSISVYLYAIPVVLTGICLLAIFWYLPAFFKSCKVELINKSVIIKSGVFIRTTHILPFERLIYTQTLSSPIAKLLNLSSINLKAARTRILIPEMETERVIMFIEEITRGDSH